MELKPFPGHFPFTGFSKSPLQWSDTGSLHWEYCGRGATSGFPPTPVHGAENSELGIWVPGRPLKVRGWVWRLGVSKERAGSDAGHPRVARSWESRRAAGASAGVGWAAQPAGRDSLPAPLPGAPRRAPARRAARSRPPPSAPRPLPTSASSLRAQPPRPASPPPSARRATPRWAAGEQAGERSRSGGGGAQPAGRGRDAARGKGEKESRRQPAASGSAGIGR